MKIAQILNYGGWGSIGPEALTEGRPLGGRETCMVEVSYGLASAGHEVINFTSRDSVFHHDHESGGRETWAPIDRAQGVLSTVYHDGIISWEHPEIFESAAIVANSGFRIMSLQCADLPGVSPNVRVAVDRWVALSKWHSRYFSASYDIPENKIEIIPNGVDTGLYLGAQLGRDHKVPGRFYYASSPDRGLIHLLRMWPEVRKQIPGAELHVVYGASTWADGARWQHNAQGNDAATILQLLNQPGVVDRGKVSKDELAQLAIESQMLLYPCDPHLPTETGCITVMDALAAMTPVLCTSADCLGSEYGALTEQVDLPFNPGEFLGRLVQLHGDDEHYQDLQATGREWVTGERDWEDITSDGWDELIVELHHQVEQD